MRTNRLFSAVTISFIFLFVAICAYAGPKGNSPTKYFWADEIGDPDPYDYPLISCGDFDVWLHIEFSGWWMVHPETPGKKQWEYYHSFSNARAYNYDNPDLFIDGVPGGKWNRKWRGVAFESNAVETGVQIMFTVPHYGVIYQDVGRVEWSPEGPVFYAGQWDYLDGFDEDIIALCTVLADDD